MKEVIVDSDILSYYFKKHKIVAKNFNDYINKKRYVYISRITVFEILSGLKSKNAKRQLEEFNKFLKKNKILELTAKSVETSSDIFADLRQKGKTSGSSDILIAGIAISNDLKLSTNNIKDYENIPNLELINWTKIK